MKSRSCPWPFPISRCALSREWGPGEHVGCIRCLHTGRLVFLLLYHRGIHDTSLKSLFLAAQGQEMEEHLMGVGFNSTYLSPLGMQKQSAKGFQQRRWSLIPHLLLLGTMSWKTTTSWAGRRGPGQAVYPGAWLGLEKKPRLTVTKKGTPTTKLPRTPSPVPWPDAVIYKFKIAYYYK